VRFFSLFCSKLLDKCIMSWYPSLCCSNHSIYLLWPKNDLRFFWLYVDLLVLSQNSRRCTMSAFLCSAQIATLSRTWAGLLVSLVCSKPLKITSGTGPWFELVLRFFSLYTDLLALSQNPDCRVSCRLSSSLLKIDQKGIITRCMDLSLFPLFETA
jgi:hypothetical protein